MVLPAFSFNIAALIEDQSKYGESAAIREMAASATSTTTVIFLVACVLSLLFICGSVALTHRPNASKIGVSLLSVFVATILFCAGVIASMAITGLPVD